MILAYDFLFKIARCRKAELVEQDKTGRIGPVLI